MFIFFCIAPSVRITKAIIWLSSAYSEKNTKTSNGTIMIPDYYYICLVEILVLLSHNLTQTPAPQQGQQNQLEQESFHYIELTRKYCKEKQIHILYNLYTGVWWLTTEVFYLCLDCLNKNIWWGYEGVWGFLFWLLHFEFKGGRHIYV